MHLSNTMLFVQQKTVSSSNYHMALPAVACVTALHTKTLLEL